MSCEVVKNEVLGKEFVYCRTHKVESTLFGCVETPKTEKRPSYEVYCGHPSTITIANQKVCFNCGEKLT